MYIRESYRHALEVLRIWLQGGEFTLIEGRLLRVVYELQEDFFEELIRLEASEASDEPNVYRRLDGFDLISANDFFNKPHIKTCTSMIIDNT